jgi:hypothetical protein
LCLYLVQASTFVVVGVGTVYFYAAAHLIIILQKTSPILFLLPPVMISVLYSQLIMVLKIEKQPLMIVSVSFLVVYFSSVEKH